MKEHEMGTELIDIDPRKLRTTEHNLRAQVKPEDVADLAASIKADGVLVPLIVTHDPTSTASEPVYRIVAGHRRALAAVEAGAETVPCVIRADLDETDGRDVRTMLSENVNRRALSAVEEASGFAQLSMLGIEVGDIAAAAGRTVADVEKAIEVTRAPKAAAVAREYDLTMEQAIALSEFEEDKGVLKALTVTAKKMPGKFDHELAQARAERDRAAERKRIEEEHRAQGVKILAKRPEYNSPATDIGHLAGEDGPMTSGEHFTCPGDAVSVEVYWNGTSRVTRYCMDPKKHGHKEYRGNRTGVAKMSEEEKDRRRAAREHAGIFKVATGVRQAFVTRLYEGKTFPAKLLPMVAREQARLSLGHRGLAPDLKAHRAIYTALSGGRTTDAAQVIEEASDKRLPVEVFLLIAASAEDQWRHDYLPSTARRYVAMLVEAGYTLADVEQEMVARYDEGNARPR